MNSFYPEDIESISKLRNLKKVGGRRVGPSNPQIQEEPTLDVSQTAQTYPEVNAPIASPNGGLDPSSYDVRANLVIDPETQELEQAQQINQVLQNRRQQAPQNQSTQAPQAPQEEQGGFWYNLGKNLQSALNPELPKINLPNPVPQNQVNQEGINPNAPVSTEALQPSFGQRVMDTINGINSPARKMRAQELADEESAQEIQEVLFNRQLEEAQQNPWETSVYGTADRFSNSPELQAQFETYTNTPWTQEIAAKEKEYETVMQSINSKYDAIDNTLSEDQQRLKNRILSGTATDADKYYIGLALLLPLIVGGTLGAEAGLSALGGAAGNLAGIFNKREENAREDEEAYRKISNDRAVLGLKKGELALEGLKVPAEIRKAMPNPNKDIEGERLVTYTNPETGEPVAQGIEILPGLIADSKYANNPKNREKMYEEAQKINRDEKPFLNRANEITEDIARVVPQIEDKKLLGTMLAVGLNAENFEEKNLLQKLYRANAPDVIVNGKKQNLAVFLDRKIELWKDSYRRNERMRSLTNTIADHLGNLVSNPLYAGLTANDLLDSILDLRKRAQENYVDSITGLGFLAQPALEEFGKRNSEIFGFLNENERQKQNKKDKRTLRASK